MWKLREIIVAAILSVVCGVIYLGWDNLTMPLFSSTVSPAVQGLVNGVWWIAAGLVAYIVRRPFAAFLGGLVSAVVEFLLGSPYGTGAIISGLVQGGGAEVGLLLGGWRRWSLPWMMLSGAVGGIGNTLQWYFQYGGDKYSAGIVVGYLVTTCMSGAVIAGLIPKLIGDALRRAGVVRNFEIGRQARERS
ncbi:MAG: ECF transporter S component [Thermoflavifilum sp.]|nr:ECF transporter S component [Thermoflavifilum sp.]MCL6514323.1 ECF transporter S component [Alicyclobacillus sp.]